MLVQLAAWPIGLFLWNHPQRTVAAALAGLLSLVLNLAYRLLFARALHRLHGVRWWWTALGFVVSLVALGLLSVWLRQHHSDVMIGLMT